MNKTRHASTNFKMLLPMIEDMKPGHKTYKRYTAGEAFMPLVIEYLVTRDHQNRPIYSMTHYAEQNGDLMRDPDMTFAVDFEAGEIDPRSYENSYLGVYQEVYMEKNGKLYYSKSLRPQLDEFLWQWLKNIKEQEYTLERDHVYAD